MDKSSQTVFKVSTLLRSEILRTGVYRRHKAIKTKGADTEKKKSCCICMKPAGVA